MPRTLIIYGSSRHDGETEKLAKQLIELSGWDMVDLNDYNISYYDYEHANRGDDFLPLMRDVLDKHDTLVFLTPVYWYAMSGIMKVFFDRITDLLTIEKDLGRKLRGKSMAVLSSSYGDNLGQQFWLPFKETARYLGMNYITDLHTVVGKEEPDALKLFAGVIGR